MKKEYEYIIVGSGVAGSSIAMRLLEHDRSTSILMLEAGPEIEAKDRRSWWDYVVQANGPEYKSYDYTCDQKGDSTTTGNTKFEIEGSRVMLYGGSTVHWGGWCLRYKPEDFQLQTNTGGGGDWPMPYADVAAYYPAAEAHLSVCGDDEEPWNKELMGDHRYPRPAFQWTAADGEMLEAFHKNGIVPGKMPMARYRKCMTTGTCKYCPIGARFSGQLVLDELRGDPRHRYLEIMTGAPVTRVLLASKSKVSGVEYLDPKTGAPTQAHAGTVLVCSGAYESPKLLMLSRSPEWTQGIGNDHDRLGRYLVSHSILKVRGRLDHNEECWFQEYDFPTLMSRTYDTREYQPLNKIMLFKNRGLPNFDFAKEMIAGKTREQIDARWRAGRDQELQAFMEEWGDEGNRVMLSRGRNRFGLPKMTVHFDRSARAQANSAKWLEQMEKVVRDMGYRTKRSDPTAPDAGQLTYGIDPPGGHHATGTCRMAATPEHGVLDSDMRVFGTHNLYVCSNAAFPTGAAVNPTLTLTAMAFRLADHLITNHAR